MRWKIKTIIIALLTLSAFVGLVFITSSYSDDLIKSYNTQEFKHDFVVVQAGHLLGFNLVDPEQAPEEMRESVMRGYHLMINTPYYAPNYVKNDLSCTNCHFMSGDTLGGKNGGISLVGVTATYPKYSKRSGKTISLPERINNCFQRSMNGKPIPEDSIMMTDIIHYLQWISKEVVAIKEVPWLGLPSIRNSHKPDAVTGKKVYENNCALCHRSDGSGGAPLDDISGKTVPPLWGKDSFNDGAGMATMDMIAPFIYLNMPYQQAGLTEEEAQDVAAYVLEQKRPHFSP